MTGNARYHQYESHQLQAGKCLHSEHAATLSQEITRRSHG